MFGLGKHKNKSTDNLAKAKKIFEKAQCLSSGDGVERDLKEAVRLYRAAAEMGYDEAQASLASAYSCGLGVEQNYEEAVKWYLLAAEQCNTFAQTNLGFCYEKGWGVDQNEREAVRLYLLAANKGDSLAQNFLGNCYYNGIGVDVDIREAFRLLTLAAEQNDPAAQSNLAMYYAYPTDPSYKDSEKAYFWICMAAMNKDPMAEKIRDMIANEINDKVTRLLIETEATKWLFEFSKKELAKYED